MMGQTKHHLVFTEKTSPAGGGGAMQIRPKTNSTEVTSRQNKQQTGDQQTNEIPQGPGSWRASGLPNIIPTDVATGGAGSNKYAGNRNKLE